MNKAFIALAVISCTHTPLPAGVIADLERADEAVERLALAGAALTVPVDHDPTPRGVGRCGVTGKAAFRHWGEDILDFAHAVDPLVPESSAEGVLLYRSLQRVRMAGTRAAGGSRPEILGTDAEWHAELRSALRWLHIDLVCAIVERWRNRTEAAAREEAQERIAADKRAKAEADKRAKADADTAKNAKKPKGEESDSERLHAAREAEKDKERQDAENDGAQTELETRNAK